MDSPELTERFVTLASMDNKAIVVYYRHIIVPLVVRHVGKTDHLLDCGCAGGVLLNLLQERGCSNVYGIDTAQVLLDRIPDRNIPVVCDSYLNVKQHYDKSQFDAVTVFNTLHHLDSKEEFYRFFENVHHIVRPGAVVIIKELYNGLFYKTYNAIIWSSIANKLLPSVFSSRNFVQTEETDMHARFFKDFVGNIKDILEAKGKFKVKKQYKPLKFERMIVLEAQ